MNHRESIYRQKSLSNMGCVPPYIATQVSQRILILLKRLSINVYGNKDHASKSVRCNFWWILEVYNGSFLNILSIFSSFEVQRSRRRIHIVNIYFYKKIINYTNSVWLCNIVHKQDFLIYSTPGTYISRLSNQ